MLYVNISTLIHVKYISHQIIRNVSWFKVTHNLEEIQDLSTLHCRKENEQTIFFTAEQPESLEEVTSSNSKYQGHFEKKTLSHRAWKCFVGGHSLVQCHTSAFTENIFVPSKLLLLL